MNATANELGLPHGPEFRFVDRIVDVQPGKSGAATYKVRGDEEFLRGHFPGNPIVPGVLLIEAVAQLAGCVAQAGRDTPLNNLKLAGVRNAKIAGTAKPGEIIDLSATITDQMANVFQASGTASVAGKVLLQADVILAGE
ncbi:MAG: 3-hydroxyacyl-ACP dehydratase FabZ family protein [Limisphaerales bacterium]